MVTSLQCQFFAVSLVQTSSLVTSLFWLGSSSPSIDIKKKMIKIHAYPISVIICIIFIHTLYSYNNLFQLFQQYPSWNSLVIDYTLDIRKILESCHQRNAWKSVHTQDLFSRIFQKPWNKLSKPSHDTLTLITLATQPVIIVAYIWSLLKHWFISVNSKIFFLNNPHWSDLMIYRN